MQLAAPRELDALTPSPVAHPRMQVQHMQQRQQHLTAAQRCLRAAAAAKAAQAAARAAEALQVGGCLTAKGTGSAGAPTGRTERLGREGNICVNDRRVINPCAREAECHLASQKMLLCIALPPPDLASRACCVPCAALPGPGTLPESGTTSCAAALMQGADPASLLARARDLEEQAGEVRHMQHRLCMQKPCFAALAVPFSVVGLKPTSLP